ncbi:ABC transporter permease, partial [Streptococcus pyogenes]
ISLIVFFGLQATGIDPINFMLSPEQLSASPEVVEQLREELGLNDPLIVQYFNWLGNLLRGDFGYSITDGTSIASTLAVRM